MCSLMRMNVRAHGFTRAQEMRGELAATQHALALARDETARYQAEFLAARQDLGPLSSPHSSPLPSIPSPCSATSFAQPRSLASAHLTSACRLLFASLPLSLVGAHTRTGKLRQMADVPGAWRPTSLRPPADSPCSRDSRPSCASSRPPPDRADVASCASGAASHKGSPFATAALGSRAQADMVGREDDDECGWEEGVSSHVVKEGGMPVGVGGALTVRSEYSEESPRTLKLRIIRQQLLNVQKERELDELRLSPGVSRCGVETRGARMGGREAEARGIGYPALQECVGLRTTKCRALCACVLVHDCECLT